MSESGRSSRIIGGAIAAMIGVPLLLTVVFLLWAAAAWAWRLIP